MAPKTKPSLRKRIRILLFASGIMACAFTLVAYLGVRFWLCDLASHFRPHYAAWLLFLAVLFCWRRHWRLTLLFAGFGGFNLSQIAPYYKLPSFSSPASPAAPILRVFLGNVLILNTQYGRMEQAIADSDADVVVLEELSPQWFAGLAGLKSRYPYSARSAATDRFGIGLWSRFPLRQIEVRQFGQTGRSTLSVTIEREGRPITVVATHPPPPFSASGAQAQERQLTAVAEFIAHHSGSLILLGDLNITPWTATFQRLVRDSGLQDSTASQGVCATWPSWVGVCGLPLDHCLTTPNLHVIRKFTGAYNGSDHLPLLLDIQISH